MTELNGFLAHHEPVAKPRLYAIGAVLGEWRVTGFLGSGGNAEVYRVVRDADGQAAAAKVLLRDDAASKARFRQEAALLSKPMGAAFAKFYAAGETDGRPYLITELLEPVVLPTAEKDIAAYLLAVCRAVGILHRAGLVHRDLKPSNVMRRANGELVLIDLGLVKDTVKSPEPEKNVSIVSTKVVAVGTPRFAAPEQLTGDAITPAADIHALGRLADMAFRSQPPRQWISIIRRATSSIPEQRYASVEDLAKAIRHRHRPRYLLAASVLAVAALAMLWLGRAGAPRIAPATQLASLGGSPRLSKPSHSENESAAWDALCQNTTTNLVVRELVWERMVTNKIGNTTLVSPERAYHAVTNRVAATSICLRGEKYEFERPIFLNPAREYFVEGPGILSADFRTEGTNVVIHLANCFLFNRSAIPIRQAGLRYVFDRGAYLNFTALDEPPPAEVDACTENFDGAVNAIQFQGPQTKAALDRERDQEGYERLLRER